MGRYQGIAARVPIALPPFLRTSCGTAPSGDSRTPPRVPRPWTTPGSASGMPRPQERRKPSFRPGKRPCVPLPDPVPGSATGATTVIVPTNLPDLDARVSEVGHATHRAALGRSRRTPRLAGHDRSRASPDPPGRLPPPVRRPAVRPRTIELRHGIAKGHGGFRPGPPTWRRSSPSGPRRGNGLPPRRQGAVPHPGAGFRRPRTRQAAPYLRSGATNPPRNAVLGTQRHGTADAERTPGTDPSGRGAPRAGRFGSEGASMAKEASFAGFAPSLPGPVSCRHSSKADRGRQSRSCHLPSSPFLFVFPQRHVRDSFRSPAGDSPEKPAGIRPLRGVSP
jgi:hypothetical protein